MARRLPTGLLVAALAPLLLPATAAAGPPNDPPWQPGFFEPYTAANGNPSEEQAIADLVGAHPDRGVPRCLGPKSFARTVWYRVPESPTPRELTVEAMGRTLDVVDLAAFVQPAVPVGPPPEPTPPPEEPPPDDSEEPGARSAQYEAPVVKNPNACAGAGAGGSDAAEEPTSAVSLHVPAGHPVLFQVGRRGRVGSRQDEAAVLSYSASDLPDFGAPAGDRADRRTPRLRQNRPQRVPLIDATITEEDPAQPACPSLGTVWRRFVPGKSGKRLIRVAGGHAQSLTVFSGKRPTGTNALDCVNRAGKGALEMRVPARKRRPLWIRIGTEHPPDWGRASVVVRPGRGVTVIDGGPGGNDPTRGGPGGGLPAACLNPQLDKARVRGPRLRGPAGARNAGRKVPLAVVVRGAGICDAELELLGPKRRVYARGRVGWLNGKRTVKLSRLLTFRRGAYKLRVTGLNWLGRRARAHASVRGRLG